MRVLEERWGMRGWLIHESTGGLHALGMGEWVQRECVIGVFEYEDKEDMT